MEGGRQEERGEPHPLVFKAEMGYLKIGMDGEGGGKEGMKGSRHERKTRVQRGGKEKGGIKRREKS